MVCGSIIHGAHTKRNTMECAFCIYGTPGCWGWSIGVNLSSFGFARRQPTDAAAARVASLCAPILGDVEREKNFRKCELGGRLENRSRGL